MPVCSQLLWRIEAGLNFYGVGLLGVSYVTSPFIIYPPGQHDTFCQTHISFLAAVVGFGSRKWRKIPQNSSALVRALSPN
jgi:hypothetical protein